MKRSRKTDMTDKDKTTMSVIVITQYHGHDFMVQCPPNLIKPTDVRVNLSTLAA